MVHFLRGVLVAGCLLASALGGRADDEPKKAADDSIMANRKDLEALRTERILAPAAEKFGLPSGFELSPSLTGSNSPAPSPRPDPKDAAATPARSSGWLIDGMEKARGASGRDTEKYGKTDDIDPRDRKDLGNSPFNSRDRLNGSNDGSKVNENDRPEGRNDSRVLKPGEKAPNPLTGYMATWMTPGDFNLLQKPAAINGSTFLKPLPDFTTQTSVGLESNGASGPAAALAAGGAGFVAGSSAAPENPYLPALAGKLESAPEAVTELGSHQLLEPVSLASPPSLGRLSPPAQEPSRVSPLLPDNLKPSDDAKYFPQLKRF
jgi:hypothetical protein